MAEDGMLALAEVNLLDCVIYTSNTRVRGKFQTPHARVSDALNLPDAEFVTLQQVGVRSLFSDETDEMGAASVMLRRGNAIVVSLAGEDSDAVRPDSVAAHAERDVKETVLEAGPYTVKGVLHLPPGGDLVQYVVESSLPFMAVTDAHIMFRPDPTSNFDAPFILVNRAWIEVMMEGATDHASQWRPARESGAAARKQAGDEVSDLGREAGEVLLATQVFNTAEVSALEKALTQLSAAGGVSRKYFYTGSEVFREGDHADALYVVASGTLEVVARDRVKGGVRRIAELKAGDVFGEIALLGEGRRTASVIGTSSGSIYEIKESALKSLVAIIPAATTTLLRVMVQRRGPRGNSARPLN